MSPLIRRTITEHVRTTGATLTHAHTMGVPASQLHPDDVILGPLDGEEPTPPPPPPPPPLPPREPLADIIGAPPLPPTPAADPVGTESFPMPGDYVAAARAIVSGPVREALPQITALDCRDLALLDAIEAAERSRADLGYEVRKTILAAVAQQRHHFPHEPTGHDAAGTGEGH